MWFKTARFVTVAERMESWQTSLDQKYILTPSKRLILCKQAIEKVYLE